MMTPYNPNTDQNEPIEATFIKYENLDDDNFIEQLENEKFKNKKLTNELAITVNSLKMAYKNLESVKKFNHKLEQDTKFYKIQVINLKNINAKFIRTINNLQSYRVYVAQLLAKRIRTKKFAFL